ncbi:RNA-directed DNA polymerase-like protein [Cucumis melo var. makuwa]|uniref:RNA-directed DNA polymerase-like protein n=1 Tax=Cucumis melo var. makuwa TaxID=1194695 RepID=A0A5D3D530_CUCMM|nr:RNA-directed DNA polymerase-like protein [Cucumis melo var. makuwa]
MGSSLTSIFKLETIIVTLGGLARFGSPSAQLGSASARLGSRLGSTRLTARLAARLNSDCNSACSSAQLGLRLGSRLGSTRLAARLNSACGSTEHQVIPMPSAKCLAITGSFPTVVQADIRQPNGFKMISAMQLDESRAQEEPPSGEILLGALEKPGETVLKDTLCVSKKHHGVTPNSWPKSSSRRRRTDHGKEPPSEAKAHAKNAYRMVPPELIKLREPSEMLSNTGCSIPVQAPYGARVLSLKKKDRSPQQCVDGRPRGVKHLPKSDDRPRQCRVRTTEAKGLEKNCVTRREAYEFPVVPLGLTDAKGGKCCSVQGQVSVPIHVGECHQGGASREEDT